MLPCMLQTLANGYTCTHAPWLIRFLSAPQQELFSSRGMSITRNQKKDSETSRTKGKLTTMSLALGKIDPTFICMHMPAGTPQIVYAQSGSQCWIGLVYFDCSTPQLCLLQCKLQLATVGKWILHNVLTAVDDWFCSSYFGRLSVKVRREHMHAVCCFDLIGGMHHRFALRTSCLEQGVLIPTVNKYLHVPRSNVNFKGLSVHRVTEI